MQAVNVLVRADRRQHGVLVQGLRQGQLHQDAVDRRVLVQLADEPQEVMLRGIGRQPVGHRVHADGERVLTLGADVDLAGGILAHQHHGEARLQAMLGLQHRHLLGHLRAQSFGIDLAIDQLGGSSWGGRLRHGALREQAPRLAVQVTRRKRLETARDLMTNFSQAFTRVASVVSAWTGRPIAFAICVLLVVIWAATGPLFQYSDTWQLVINTSTTIITFLMVFLIQNTQNRDNAALQAKLDELIRTSKAKNEFIGIEHLSDSELSHILEECEKHRPGVLRRAEAEAPRKQKAQIRQARTAATRGAKAPT